MPLTFPHAVHPACLAIAFSPITVEIFSSSEAGISHGFPVPVSCKRIIGVTFLGPLLRVVRLAVLSEQFTTPPSLDLFDLDLPNLRYTHDDAKKVALPVGSYLVATLAPESTSLAIVFTAQQAVRVQFSAGLLPIVTTATIFTPNRVQDIRHLHSDWYVYIDAKGVIGQVELKESDTLNFTVLWCFSEIPEVDIRFAVVPISRTLIAGVSTAHDSVVLNISGRPSVVQLFPSIGKLKRVHRTQDGFFGLGARGTVSLTEKCELSLKSGFECEGFERIFRLPARERLLICSASAAFEVAMDGEIVPDPVFPKSTGTLFITDAVHVTRNLLRFSSGNRPCRSNDFRF
jgi:hypothetical protein